MSRALWHVSPKHSELRDVCHPENQSLQQVHALFSMVSTGTERLVARGEVDATCDQSMSVPFMEGSFELPIKYGYSLVGSNEDGEILHCMHPHQSTVYVAEDNFFLTPEGSANTVSPDRHRVMAPSSTKYILNSTTSLSAGALYQWTFFLICPLET